MIRVVVVEQSIAGRDQLVRALEADGDIQVVGRASRAKDAITLVASERPDLVTLDIPLSDGDGQQVIEQVMAFNPTPILVISALVTGPASQAAVEALVAGAVEAVPEPDEWGELASLRLRERVRVLRGVTVVRHVRGRLGPRRPIATTPDLPPAPTPIVAIGASTGGPAALATILPGLDGVRAAILVVQHLHPDFIEGFVTWMARISAVPVELAVDAARLRPGVIYIAPGGSHMKLGATDRIVLDTEPETLHRPSVDALFSSLAKRPNGKKVGVLLTGIGDDGAAGLLDLHAHGGVTIAQDEATSAVFGMPAAAQRLGAVTRVLALDDIATAIMEST